MSDDVTFSIPRSRLRLLVVAAVTAALVAPAAAWAGHRFADVPNASPFHGDIDWMADNGVTAGCNPPDNDEFCPRAVVTREQMAAFISRLDTRDVFTTFAEAESIASAATAGPVDADRLDGKDSTAFLPATGQVRVSAMAWASAIPGEIDVARFAAGVKFDFGEGSIAAVAAHPTLPQTLLGTRMAVAGWEYCYQARSGAILDLAELQVVRGSATTASTLAAVSDDTDRTDSACRTLTFDTPVPLTDDTYVSPTMVVDVNSGSVDLSRSVIILETT